MKRSSTLGPKALALCLALLGSAVTAASADVILRTPPFPGPDVFSGEATCVARNGGTARVTVTVKMFSNAGVVLGSGTDTLLADEAETFVGAFLNTKSPSWCECSVPNATTVTCSFVYKNGSISAVVPAQ